MAVSRLAIGVVLAAGLVAAAACAVPAEPADSIQVESGPRHAWSGETIRLAVRVANPTAASTAPTLRWEVALSGAALARGEQTLALPPGGSQTVKIEFEAPRVSHVSDALVRLSLRSGEGMPAELRVPLTVYPAWDPEPLRRLLDDSRLAIADPSGRLQALLAEHDLSARALATAPEVRAFRGQALVLGPGARDAPNLTEAALDAAASGATVLWLEAGDTSRWKATFGLPSAQAAEAAQPAALAPGHPALGEIRASDFEGWRAGAVFAMAAPDGGNFRPLLAAGAGSGSCLMEVFVGSGRIVLCQMPALRDFTAEPVARMLLESLVRYASLETPPFQPAAMWAPPESKLGLLLEKAGVSLTTDGLPAALFIVAADARAARCARERDPALPEKIRAHLAAGGKCLLLGAEPGSAPLLEGAGLRGVTFEPAPKDARLRPEPPPRSVLNQWALTPDVTKGAAKGRTPSFLSWGLTSEDLAAAARAGDDPPLLRYAVAPGADATVAVSPGAVVKLPVGAGEAIFCQLAMDRAPEDPAAIAVLRQLLTNLGTRLERKDP